MATLREGERRPQLPYSESLKVVLQSSKEEAKRLDHNYIGTEHILLGLTREQTAMTVLNTLERKRTHFPEITTVWVRSCIESLIGRGEPMSAVGEIGLTPRAKKVLELAMDEANRAGAKEVNSIHAVIGLIRERDGLGSGILESVGIRSEQIPFISRKAREFSVGAKKAAPHKSDAELEAESKQGFVMESVTRLEVFLENPENDEKTKVRIANIVTELITIASQLKPEEPKSNPPA